jgi:hypothetical protein
MTRSKTRPDRCSLRGLRQQLVDIRPSRGGPAGNADVVEADAVHDSCANLAAPFALTAGETRRPRQLRLLPGGTADLLPAWRLVGQGRRRRWAGRGGSCSASRRDARRSAGRRRRRADAVTPQPLRRDGDGPPRGSGRQTRPGRDPYDRELSDLVGELSTRSETFRTPWAAHNVRFHNTGSKALPSPGRRRP